MKLTGYALGVVAALSCGSAFAQKSDHGSKDKGQKNQKPVNQAEVDFQDRVIAASKVYKDGNTDESLKQFEQLNSEQPNHKDVVSWLGFLYLRTNQADKAVSTLEKASELAPDDLEVWNNLGNAYMMADMPEKAIGAFQKVSEKKSDMFEPLYNVGTIYLHRKDYDQAIASLTKASQLRSDDPFTMNNLGVAYEGNKNYAEAGKAFAKASELKPDNQTFAKNAGFAYYRQKDYANAITFLQRASDLDSKDAQVNLALSDSYMKTGRKEEAAKYYDAAATDQNDNSPFWYNLGVIRMTMKNAAGAEEAYQKALSINPNDIDALNNLGVLYFNEGKYQESETTFEKLIGMDNGLQPKLNLAAAACKAGDLPRATTVWKEVIQSSPEKNDVRTNLANALWMTNDYEGAKYHYAEVLHRDKTNAEALNGMGMWYLQNSRLADAKTAFQGSIRTNPNNALAYNNLAVTLERMNQRKQAIALLERASKLAPDNQQIQSNLKRMKSG
jgi:Flp pilus assembly protein TadD